MIILEMVIGYFGAAAAGMLWIVTALATWRVFIKAGLAGWKSLIPVYREYLLFRIAWNQKSFRIYAVVVILSSAMEVLASSAGETSIYGTIGAVVDLAVIYYEVMLKVNLAKAFGRGHGFGLFLYFLEPIAMAGLGFGPDEYIGPEGIAEEAEG